MINLYKVTALDGHRLSAGPDAPGMDPCGDMVPAFRAKRLVDSHPAPGGQA
jgi:hypothetical protein